MDVCVLVLFLCCLLVSSHVQFPNINGHIAVIPYCCSVAINIWKSVDDSL